MPGEDILIIRSELIESTGRTTGVSIGMLLRDRGLPLWEVSWRLAEAGYKVERRDFQGLPALWVSEDPEGIPDGQVSNLIIWLRPIDERLQA
jgi:hypothetical protein